MPINFDLNKLSQLLSPLLGQQQQSPTNPNMGVIQQQGMNQSGIGSGSQDDELNQAILALLTPKDEQYDRFTQMLNMMPQRSQYEPSKRRNIGAFLAGLGSGGPAAYSGGAALGFKADIPEGLKTQRSINDEPYNRALSDWTGKASNTLEAAKLENSKNVNSRTAGSSIKTAQLREQGLDRQLARDAQVKTKEDAETARKAEDVKIRKQRADAYVYKTMHPNHKFIETNGLVYSIDPVTNANEVVKDSDGDPIESDKLGDADKANLGLKNSKELENLRQSNREKTESDRQLNRLELKSTPSPETEDKPLTPSGTATDKVNRIINIVTNDPSLKPYFVYGGNKKPTGEMVAPKSGKDENYDRAKSILEGSNKDIKLKPSKTLAAPEEDPRIKAAKAKVEPGYILMTDGTNFIQVPKGKLPKDSKWKVVP